MSKRRNIHSDRQNDTHKRKIKEHEESMGINPGAPEW